MLLEGCVGYSFCTYLPSSTITSQYADVGGEDLEGASSFLATTIARSIQPQSSLPAACREAKQTRRESYYHYHMSFDNRLQPTISDPALYLPGHTRACGNPQSNTQLLTGDH